MIPLRMGDNSTMVPIRFSGIIILPMLFFIGVESSICWVAEG